MGVSFRSHEHMFSRLVAQPTRSGTHATIDWSERRTGTLSATSKLRISRRLSVADSRRSGCSFASPRSTLLVSRLLANADVTRSLGSAPRSCRRSQLIRVCCRPSLGAASTTLVVTWRDRRFATTSIGATASGTRIEAASSPLVASRRICSPTRSACACLRGRAGVTSRPSSCESPSARYSTNCSQLCATSRTPASLAHSVPCRAPSRTVTHARPMSWKPLAPDFSWSR